MSGLQRWSGRETRALREALRMSVAVAPEVQHLAASTGSGRVRLWDLPSGEMRWERDADAGRVRSIAFDDCGDVLAACGGDGLVRVWHAPTGDPVTDFSNPAADGTARIWSLSEQRQLAEVRLDASLQCAAFHPATGRLLAASAAGVAMVTVDVSDTSR